MTRTILVLIIFSVVACTPARKGITIDPYNYSSQKSVTVSNGAVVSAHPLASKIGVEILKKGGNAFDAVIATQLALAVVFPEAGNIGGGGFAVGRKADGQLIAIDFREKAPEASHRDMFVDPDGTARTDKSQMGHLASGVPGAVAGVFEIYKHAKLPFKELVQPAIDLAEKGFVLGKAEASALNSLQEELKQYNTIMPVFVKAGGWKETDTLVQKDLGKVLIRIRDQGPDGFYKGETARLITEEMKRGNGIITEKDLASYSAVIRDPHIFSYKDYEVIGMPMPASGGLLLNQMMKMIEKRNIANMGFHTTASVQLMTEVERRAFADRGEYLGDPDFYKVPVNKLTDEKYLEERMKDYDPSKASVSVGPGKLQLESDQTTHISIIDKEGNAVALTTTLNDSYGSKTVIGGAGFFMNDEMDDFSIKPGVPNMYGAIGGAANAIEPGKRMLSSMTPTIVLKDQKPFLVLGTPGGTRIPTTVFQAIINIIEFNLSPEQTVNSPRFHHQWLPDILYVEKDFPVQVIEDLRRMGYTVNYRGKSCRLELIKILPDGRYEAVADWRGEDAAEGY